MVALDVVTIFDLRPSVLSKPVLSILKTLTWGNAVFLHCEIQKKENETYY